MREEGGRLFLWVPILIACGISLYFSLSVERSLIVPLIISGLLGLLCLLPPVRRHEGSWLLILIFFWVSVGFSAAKLREVSVSQPLLISKTAAAISGEILEIDASDKKRRILIRILDGTAEGGILPHQVRVSDRFGKVKAEPGDIINADVFLLPLPSPTHAGAFDFQRQLYFQGIGAVGYIRDVEEITKSDKGWFIKRAAENVRFALGQEILDAAPDEAAGFLLAIMTGERKALSKGLQEDMRRSGLAHLLAISGLHMGMLGGTLFFLIRFLGALSPRIALTWPVKKIAAFVALLGMAGYLMISGMSVSAIRAFFMISLIFLAVLFDRRAISFRNLAMAAILILLFRPESLLGASFHMSFAAVFCLIAAYERFGDQFWILGAERALPIRLMQYLGGVLLTSLIASLATAPFAAFHFGQFSVAGNLANLIAVPLMGLYVMPLVLLSFLLYPVGGMELGLYLSGLGVSLIQDTAAWVADFPIASIAVPAFSPYLLYGMIFGCLWFIIWRHKIRYLSVIFIFLGIFSAYLYQPPDILISGSGRLVLLRAEGELFVNNRRVDRFERQRWQQIYGVSDNNLFRSDAATAASIKCDDLGCVATMKGQVIAFSSSRYSHRLDCQKADILIAEDPVTISCPKPEHVIDRFDVWRQGGHSLWLNGQESRIETVNGTRGVRPWIPTK